MQKKNLLEVKNLKTFFPVKKGFFKTTVGYLRAVDDISFVLQEGKTLGLVGESGCGKSTLGKTILNLQKPSSGHVFFEGVDIFNLNTNEMRYIRKKMQLIFQDPYSSLNPRMTISDILTEPFIIHKLYDHSTRAKKVKELISTVGLTQQALNKYPHEFSGGQRQRIGIARALTLSPRLIVADEPVSALDVSIQSQILNLLVDIREEYDFSTIFISHDLAVIEHISDFVAVMYLGKIVEYTSQELIYSNPLHPYTKALINAIPQATYNPARQKKQLLEGDVPNPINPPTGCAFHPRCPMATNICKKSPPVLKEEGTQENSHLVACHNL